MGNLADRADDLTVDERHAFLVVRHESRTWVVDLTTDQPTTVGRGPEATLLIEDEKLEELHATLTWDLKTVSLEGSRAGLGTFLNGKRAEGKSELKPGDEIGVGGAQLVLGVSVPLTAGGRRALTHHEFRERLAEELARATRRGCPTALVMVQAKAGDGGRVSAAALKTFRAGDVVATYASDELEFLLPDTGLDEARAVVERISGNANSKPVAGIAVAPEDGDDADRVLYAARLALHDALRGGKSRPPDSLMEVSTPEIHDAATKELVAGLEAAGGSNTSVLLTGEISTGKGVFAHLLHNRSQRRGGPFVPIACAALFDDDAAIRAFGGQAGTKGSTAALALGGTLLLEEVGDLPPGAQQRLLSLIEREGDQLRLVSTTHRTLAGLVERGAFGAALHERLAGVVLELPALRARPDDIIPLALRFAEESGARVPVDLAPGAVARLRSYPWPGNVLELRNAMERAVRLAGTGAILAEHLPSEPLPIASSEGRLREHVDAVERDAIIKALADSNHNQTHAARRLGISRRALIYKMEKYGLKRPPGQKR